MSLRMASPKPHPKTGTDRVRLAVPKHLREATGLLYGQRAELIANLGTKDASEARRRASAATAELRSRLEAAERLAAGEAVSLSERDVEALAGRFYRREVERWDADPGPAKQWTMALEWLREQADAEEALRPSRADLEPARALLKERGLPSDPTTLARLGTAIGRARIDVARLMERRAEGDWSKDRTAERFPAALPAATVPQADAAAPGPFTSLLAGFAADKGWGRTDASPIDRNLYDRKRTLAPCLVPG